MDRMPWLLRTRTQIVFLLNKKYIQYSLKWPYEATGIVVNYFASSSKSLIILLKNISVSAQCLTHLRHAVRKVVFSSFKTVVG